MRTFIIRLLLVSVSMIAATLQAQNITFNHLTTDDGLSQFSVNSLYIDENGVLWIGTREGLNRYDGEDIQTYKLQKNDPYSLFCNTVLRMAGNRNGKIYLLCTEGVAEFNLATQRFTTLLQGNVHSIYYKEALFIGKQNEIYRYNEQTGNFDLYYQLPGKSLEICCMHLDKGQRTNVDWNDHRRSIPPATGQERADPPHPERQHHQHIPRQRRRVMDWQLGRRAAPCKDRRNHRNL